MRWAPMKILARIARERLCSLQLNVPADELQRPACCSYQQCSQQLEACGQCKSRIEWLCGLNVVVIVGRGEEVGIRQIFEIDL